MILDLHPQFTVQKLTIGRELAPLLVIDNFVDEPERLVRKAAAKHFASNSAYYPGIRAEAPLGYQQLFQTKLKALLFDYFHLEGGALQFKMCHYSLVTTPADKLSAIQRIPHIDSLESGGLATIHYLFKGRWGGTAFYRHRQTGFEYVDEDRKLAYFGALENQDPPPGYINGSTELFEQIDKQDGVFNRMLVYRRNSLHSGCIDEDFVPDPNPLSGRLSINCFIDVVP